MKRRFIIFLVLGSFACGNGLAVTVNLNFSGAGWGDPGEDFNGNLGAAPDDPANTFWTDTNVTSQVNLPASDGTPTTIGFTLSGAANDINWNSSITNNSGAIYERGFFGNDDGGSADQLIITGLSDTSSYDVYLYSGIKNGLIFGSRFVSEGRTQFVTGFYTAMSTFERDTNYAKFSGLSPSNGAIIIDLENFGMGGGPPPDFHEKWCLAGFQITDQLVPEPNLPATGTVNVNFSSSGIPGGTWGQNFDGNAGAAPDPGNTFWTDQFWITGRDLVASDGSTMTGIDFVISGWHNDISHGDFSGIDLEILLLGHRTISGGPPGELFLSGLSPTNGYDVYIYTGMVSGSGGLHAGRYVAGGVTLDVTGGNFDTFERLNNYVKFSNLTPSASGELAISLQTPPSGGFPGWSFTGFQITSELVSDFDTVASTSSVFNAVFSATFDSESNTLYGLESTTDLVGGAWTPNDEVVTGNGGSMELFKSTDPDDSRSHRVIVLP